MDEYIKKDGKNLRYGYTTGSCATAATKACCEMLFLQKSIDIVEITTKNGTKLSLEVLNPIIHKDYVSCAIKKDSGDDPDVTNGMLIYSKVQKSQKGIAIDGGIGIGRVTQKGLDAEVGQGAINSTPRRTIRESVTEVCKKYGYTDGIDVVIYAPEGEEIAKRTFNSRLGIIGGISILGTTGIVEPMSEKALIDTIKASVNIKKAQGRKHLLITPGNYGESYTMDSFRLDKKEIIQCSNFIGDTIEYIMENDFDGMLLIGHIGKLIKICGNMFNTHSKYGDNRAEIFAAYSALCGAKQEDIAKILSSISTEDMLEIADNAQIKDKVLDKIIEKIMFNINYKTQITENFKVEVVLFSQKSGFLISSKGADEMLKKIKEENETSR